MKMIKSIVISPLIVLLVLFASCLIIKNNIYAEQLNENLILNSIELTCTMDSLAQSTEYMKLFSGQPELLEFVAAIGEDEYKSPDKAVLIRISDAVICSILEDMVGELNLPDDAYEMVVSRICSSIPAFINAQQGVNTIAATSMLTASKILQQHKDFTENTYVILLYDNYNSITLFRNSAEGIVSASSTFLFLTDDMKNSILEETVTDYIFGSFSISGVEVEYVDRR